MFLSQAINLNVKKFTKMFYDILYQIVSYLPTYWILKYSIINSEWNHIVEKLLSNRIQSPPKDDILIKLKRIDYLCRKLPKRWILKGIIFTDCLSIIGAKFAVSCKKPYFVDFHIRTLCYDYVLSVKTSNRSTNFEYCFPLNEHEICFIEDNYKISFIISFGNFIEVKKIKYNLGVSYPSCDRNEFFDFYHNKIRWLGGTEIYEFDEQKMRFLENHPRVFDCYSFNDRYFIYKWLQDIFIGDLLSTKEWNLNHIDELKPFISPKIGSFALKFETVDFIWLEAISCFLVWIKGACVALSKEDDTLKFRKFLPRFNKTKSQKAISDNWNKILIIVSDSSLRRMTFEVVSFSEIKSML